MKKLIITFFLSILTTLVFGQLKLLNAISRKLADFIPERVSLHLDKKTCLAGDTILFKGEIVEGNVSSRSTSLHVELVNSKGDILARGRFFIGNGISLGYIPIPKQLLTGIYYVQAYTGRWTNFSTEVSYSEPITITDGKTALIASLEKPRSLDASTGDGLDMTSSAGEKGIYTVLMCDDTSKYAGMKMHFMLISPAITAYKDFRLKAGKNEEIFVPFKNGERGNEVDILLLSDTIVIMQQKIIIPPKKLSVDLRLDTLSNERKGFNSWTLDVKDSTIATLSVSIVDADVDSTKSSPDRYISVRNVDYRKIISGQPLFEYIDSEYISYKGRVERGHSKKKTKGKNLFALISFKDSTKSFQTIPLDDSGGFEIKRIFFDTATIHFQTEEKGYKAKDVVLKFQLPFKPQFFQDRPEIETEKKLDTSTLLAVTRTRVNLIEANENAKMLPEAIVTGHKKTMIEQLDEIYTSVPGDQDTRSFDIIHDSTWIGGNILDYLQSHVPSIEIKWDGNQATVYHRRAQVGYFVDEEERSYDFFSSISISNIAYLKFFPQTPMASLMRPAVCIYTKKGNPIEWGNIYSQGLAKAVLPGYTKPIFLPTDCQGDGSSPFPDNRITLYWNPSMNTKSVIRFYNNDYTRRFKLVVHGLGLNGELLYFEKIIER